MSWKNSNFTELFSLLQKQQGVALLKTWSNNHTDLEEKLPGKMYIGIPTNFETVPPALNSCVFVFIITIWEQPQKHFQLSFVSLFWHTNFSCSLSLLILTLKLTIDLGLLGYTWNHVFYTWFFFSSFCEPFCIKSDKVNYFVPQKSYIFWLETAWVLMECFESDSALYIPYTTT